MSTKHKRFAQALFGNTRAQKGRSSTPQELTFQSGGVVPLVRTPVTHKAAASSPVAPASILHMGRAGNDQRYEIKVIPITLNDQSTRTEPGVGMGTTDMKALNVCSFSPIHVRSGDLFRIAMHPTILDHRSQPRR